MYYTPEQQKYINEMMGKASSAQNINLNFGAQQQLAPNIEEQLIREFAETEEGKLLAKEEQELITKQRDAFQRFKIMKADPTKAEQTQQMQMLEKKVDSMVDILSKLISELGGVNNGS